MEREECKICKQVFKRLLKSKLIRTLYSMEIPNQAGYYAVGADVHTLKSVRQKLYSRKYKALTDFCHDIALIWHCVYKSFPMAHHIFHLAVLLEVTFKTEFKNVMEEAGISAPDGVLDVPINCGLIIMGCPCSNGITSCFNFLGKTPLQQGNLSTESAKVFLDGLLNLFAQSKNTTSELVKKRLVELLTSEDKAGPVYCQSCLKPVVNQDDNSLSNTETKDSQKSGKLKCKRNRRRKKYCEGQNDISIKSIAIKTVSVESEQQVEQIDENAFDRQHKDEDYANIKFSTVHPKHSEEVQCKSLDQPRKDSSTFEHEDYLNVSVNPAKATDVEPKQTRINTLSETSLFKIFPSKEQSAKTASDCQNKDFIRSDDQNDMMSTSTAKETAVDPKKSDRIRSKSSHRRGKNTCTSVGKSDTIMPTKKAEAELVKTKQSEPSKKKHFDRQRKVSSCSNDRNDLNISTVPDKKTSNDPKYSDLCTKEDQHDISIATKKAEVTADKPNHSAQSPKKHFHRKRNDSSISKDRDNRNSTTVSHKETAFQSKQTEQMLYQHSYHKDTSTTKDRDNCSIPISKAEAALHNTKPTERSHKKDSHREHSRDSSSSKDAADLKKSTVPKTEAKADSAQSEQTQCKSLSRRQKVSSNTENKTEAPVELKQTEKNHKKYSDRQRKDSSYSKDPYHPKTNDVMEPLQPELKKGKHSNKNYKRSRGTAVNPDDLTISTTFTQALIEHDNPFDLLDESVVNRYGSFFVNGSSNEIAEGLEKTAQEQKSTEINRNNEKISSTNTIEDQTLQKHDVNEPEINQRTLVSYENIFETAEIEENKFENDFLKELKIQNQRKLESNPNVLETDETPKQELRTDVVHDSAKVHTRKHRHRKRKSEENIFGIAESATEAFKINIQNDLRDDHNSKLNSKKNPFETAQTEKKEHRTDAVDRKRKLEENIDETVANMERTLQKDNLNDSRNDHRKSKSNKHEKAETTKRGRRKDVHDSENDPSYKCDTDETNILKHSTNDHNQKLFEIGTANQELRTDAVHNLGNLRGQNFHNRKHSDENKSGKVENVQWALPTDNMNESRNHDNRKSKSYKNIFGTAGNTNQGFRTDVHDSKNLYSRELHNRKRKAEGHPWGTGESAERRYDTEILNDSRNEHYGKFKPYENVLGTIEMARQGRQLDFLDETTRPYNGTLGSTDSFYGTAEYSDRSFQSDFLENTENNAADESDFCRRQSIVPHGIYQPRGGRRPISNFYKNRAPYSDNRNAPYTRYQAPHFYDGNRMGNHSYQSSVPNPFHEQYHPRHDSNSYGYQSDFGDEWYDRRSRGSYQTNRWNHIGSQSVRSENSYNYNANVSRNVYGTPTNLPVVANRWGYENVSQTQEKHQKAAENRSISLTAQPKEPDVSKEETIDKNDTRSCTRRFRNGTRWSQLTPEHKGTEESKQMAQTGSPRPQDQFITPSLTLQSNVGSSTVSRVGNSKKKKLRIAPITTNYATLTKKPLLQLDAGNDVVNPGLGFGIDALTEHNSKLTESITQMQELSREGAQETSEEIKLISAQPREQPTENSIQKPAPKAPLESVYKLALKLEQESEQEQVEEPEKPLAIKPLRELADVPYDKPKVEKNEVTNKTEQLKIEATTETQATPRARRKKRKHEKRVQSLIKNIAHREDAITTEGLQAATDEQMIPKTESDAVTAKIQRPSVYERLAVAEPSSVAKSIGTVEPTANVRSHPLIQIPDSFAVPLEVAKESMIVAEALKVQPTVEVKPLLLEMPPSEEKPLAVAEPSSVSSPPAVAEPPLVPKPLPVKELSSGPQVQNQTEPLAVIKSLGVEDPAAVAEPQSLAITSDEAKSSAKIQPDPEVKVTVRVQAETESWAQKQLRIWAQGHPIAFDLPWLEPPNLAENTERAQAKSWINAQYLAWVNVQAHLQRQFWAQALLQTNCQIQAKTETQPTVWTLPQLQTMSQLQAQTQLELQTHSILHSKTETKVQPQAQLPAATQPQDHEEGKQPAGSWAPPVSITESVAVATQIRTVYKPVMSLAPMKELPDDGLFNMPFQPQHSQASQYSDAKPKTGISSTVDDNSEHLTQESVSAQTSATVSTQKVRYVIPKLSTAAESKRKTSNEKNKAKVELVEARPLVQTQRAPAVEPAKPAPKRRGRAPKNAVLIDGVPKPKRKYVRKNKVAPAENETSTSAEPKQSRQRKRKAPAAEEQQPKKNKHSLDNQADPLMLLRGTEYTTDAKPVKYLNSEEESTKPRTAQQLSRDHAFDFCDTFDDFTELPPTPGAGMMETNIYYYDEEREQLRIRLQKLSAESRSKFQFMGRNYAEICSAFDQLNCGDLQLIHNWLVQNQLDEREKCESSEQHAKANPKKARLKQQININSETTATLETLEEACGQDAYLFAKQSSRLSESSDALNEPSESESSSSNSSASGSTCESDTESDVTPERPT